MFVYFLQVPPSFKLQLATQELLSLLKYLSVDEELQALQSTFGDVKTQFMQFAGQSAH